jgi:galactokinase
VTPSVRAHGPGRVNLIGEHTDYNDGLALPFAIDRGVTVTATSAEGDRIHAHAADLDEHDEFGIDDIRPADGWRAFVRGTVAELRAAGHEIAPTRLKIEGDLPHGAGLSSSAALEAALCLALVEDPGDRLELARL